MPILIRILLQRLALIAFSVLGFFGFNPDITPPSAEVVQAVQRQQDELVQEVLRPSDTGPTDSESLSAPQQQIKDVEDKIGNLQDAITDAVVDPVKQALVEKAVPSEVVAATSDFNIKDVVVNVLCLEKAATYTKMSTGSGVLISETGLVLTNAHVAYPFLQTKQFDRSTYSCSVRRENLPYAGYNAELVYYPLDWLQENSEVIKNPAPVGTGENDYAIILLTTPIGPTPKPDAFPFASLGVLTSDLREDMQVKIAGYPSSNTGVFEVDTSPGLKVADTNIEEFFTFGTRTYDVVQTGVNAVAHRGSSGGGVFRDDTLFGLIVTTNDHGEGSYANALTVPYIKGDFEDDTGINLDQFVRTSLDILKLRFSVTYRDELNRLISESLAQ